MEEDIVKKEIEERWLKNDIKSLPEPLRSLFLKLYHRVKELEDGYVPPEPCQCPWCKENRKC